MLAISGNHSYVIYLYADGLIQWTTSDNQGGIGGISGSGAHLGYSRFNIAVFLLSGSSSCDIIRIASRSNVNVPGMFVFKLDEVYPVFGK